MHDAKMKLLMRESLRFFTSESKIKRINPFMWTFISNAVRRSGASHGIFLIELPSRGVVEMYREYDESDSSLRMTCS